MKAVINGKTFELQSFIVLCKDSCESEAIIQAIACDAKNYAQWAKATQDYDDHWGNYVAIEFSDHYAVGGVKRPANKDASVS